MPESVLVCEKENGATSIKRLEEKNLGNGLKNIPLESYGAKEKSEEPAGEDENLCGGWRR